MMHPRDIEIGMWVESVAVGSKDSFVGRVIEHRTGGWVIGDAERRSWLRDSSELNPAPVKETAS